MTIMRWLYKTPLRLRSVFRRNRVEQELNDELHFHLDCLTEENLQRGLTPKEAREAAARALGGMDQFKEECRDARSVHFIETLLQDLRYGLRMLIKYPGFSAVVVLILALGICSTATVFSIIDGLILRPLPAKNPDQLVWLFLGRDGYRGPSLAISHPDYMDMCRQSKAFSAIVASARHDVRISAGDQPQAVNGELVSDNYFSVLGIPAALGRVFLPGEDWSRFQSTPVVLGYGLWQRKFGSDPGIIGQEIIINEKKAVVLGVVPAWYAKFRAGMATDLWFPVNAWIGEKNSRNRELRFNFDLLGRLHPDADVTQAQVEMDAAAHWLSESFPSVYKDMRCSLTKETEEQTKKILMASMIMLAVSMVLVICCANISGMMLARADTRQSEIAVRLALGAGRNRLLRQLLTESALLAFLGGGLGLVFTFWLLRLQSLLMPAGMFAVHFDLRVDARVVLFTSAITMFTALITGLAPALRATKPDLVSILKKEQRRVGIGKLWLSGRSILLIGQTVLSLILVVGAGSFLKSLVSSMNIDPGFDTKKNLLTMAAKFSSTGAAAHQGDLNSVMERIRALPGVKNASYAMNLFDASAGAKGMDVGIEGVQPPAGKKGVEIGYNVIGPDYFQTIGKRMLRGRFFETSGGMAPQQEVIINKTMAAKFWPQTDPIGKFITAGLRNYQIVGIAQDGRDFKELRKHPEPYIYFPFTDMRILGGCFVIETAGDPWLMVNAVKREIRALDRSAGFMMVETAKDMIGRGLWVDRMLFLLAGALGCIGIFLTAAGLYGVVAYMVQRRTQEIGVRLALGARDVDVIRLGLRRVLVIAIAGIVLGLGPAVAVTIVLAHLSEGIRSVDPIVLAGSCLFVFCVTLLAGYIPARRAANVDPMTALRCE